MPIQRLIGLEWATPPSDYMDGGLHELGRYQALATGVVKQFRIYRNATAGYAKVNIYDDSKGKLWASDSSTALSSGWNSINTSNVSVTLDAYYYLGFAASSGCVSGDDIAPAGIYAEVTYSSFTAPASVSAYGADPFNWRSCVQAWGYVPPTITDAEDEQLAAGETDFHLTVTNGETSQGGGKVWLSDSATWNAGTRVEQTVTSWSDTEIVITCVGGSLTSGTRYLWIETDSGQHNATGYSVTFTAASNDCAVSIQLGGLDFDVLGEQHNSALVEIQTPGLTESVDADQHNASTIEIQLPALSFSVSTGEISEGPIVEYLINEAASGSTPASVLDVDRVDPCDLTTTRSGGVPGYTTNDQGRGLSYGADPAHAIGSFSSALTTGDKVYDAIEGSKTATLELVWELPASAYGSQYIGNLFGLMTEDGEGPVEFAVWFWEESGSQYLEFSCFDNGAVRNPDNLASHYYKRRFSLSGLFGTTVVIHAVFDSTLATEADRMKIYVDGVRKTVIRGGEGDLDVPINTSIGCAGEGSWDTHLSLGGIVDYYAGVGTARGKLFYGSLYNRALTAGEISDRYDFLSISNDLAYGSPTENSCDVSIQFPGITESITAGQHNAALMGVLLPGLTESVTAEQYNAVHVDAQLPGITLEVIAMEENECTVSIQIQGSTCEVTAEQHNAADVSAVVGGMRFLVKGSYDPNSQNAGNIPAGMSVKFHHHHGFSI